MKRSELLETLTKIAPALSTSDTIPALTHFWFRGDDVMAFNDRIALSTPCKTDFVGALPGKLLLAMLKATQADELEVTEKNNQIIFKSKESTFKLAYMPESSFVFDMPKAMSQNCIVASDRLEELKNAIALCMLSVKADSSVPERLGITIVPYSYDKKDSLTLYATNGETISKNKLYYDKVNLSERVIINEEFCNKLTSMKEVEHIEINNEYALTIGEGVTLFGRIISSEQPLNFSDIIKYHTPEEAVWVDYPPEVNQVIERAMIVSSIGDAKSTWITYDGKSIIFVTEAPMGDIRDVLVNMNEHPNASGSFNAKLVGSGLKHYKYWLVTNAALILRDSPQGKAIYMIASQSE